MKVALFTDADAFAGTERHMLALALGLRELEISVWIACPAPSPLADRAAEAGVPVIPIAKSGFIDRRAAKTLAALLRSGQLDLIHSHNGRTALAAALAVRKAGAGRCIATQHFLTPNHATQRGPKAWLSRLAHRWVDDRTHHFIAISNAVRNEMLGRGQGPADKITVIHNGIPDIAPSAREFRAQARAELGAPAGGPLILCASRLEAEKDIPTLISAMALVRGAHPSARCVIAGQGANELSIRAQISSLCLEAHVTLLGFRSDVPALIDAADLFVLPCPVEGFGLVLIEAMALAKPVIATRAGGPVEIVADDETGLLVPAADPEALARAILRLANAPHTRQGMGRRGRERFLEHFTAQKMAQTAAGVYRRVLEPAASTVSRASHPSDTAPPAPTADAPHATP